MPKKRPLIKNAYQLGRAQDVTWGRYATPNEMGVTRKPKPPIQSRLVARRLRGWDSVDGGARRDD